MRATDLLLLAGSAALCLLSALLIVYLRYHRSEALKGDASAARKLVLPAFEPLLWLMTSVNALLAFAFSAMLVLHIEFTHLPVIASECVFAAQQFVVLVVLVLLLQKSVSLPALRRAAVTTLLLSTYSIPIVLAVDTHTSSSSITSSELAILLARVAVFVLYVLVLLRPPARATPSTMQAYCVFASVYHALLIASQEVLQLHRAQPEHPSGWRSEQLQYALVCASQCWGLLSPVAIWCVLKADTELWRGLGQSALEHHHCSGSDSSVPVSGILERISSEGLHVLIEMHRKHVIDFAYLALRERIGLGASSTVFRGLLYSKTAVAVKVYTPPELTDDVVASFSREAALCATLHHPNIVKFFGMCVSPPTICLVFERCCDSLSAITTAMALRRNVRGERAREQFLVNLGFMLDAARAVAYIHSFSPAFVHRDIKPSNFLVDEANSVKLTDFGESRCLPRAHIASSSSYANSGGSTNSSTNDGALEQPPRLTIRGTADYMAPELIRGRAGLATYDEAADIYALGVTFWDILYPQREKFPRLRSNHLHVFQAVLDGERPAFPSTATAPATHTELRHVIEMAWHEDACRRPSAQYIVALLERMQEHECARFARSFRQTLVVDCSVGVAALAPVAVAFGVGFDPLTQAASTTGAHAVAVMVKRNVVPSHAAAIRLGNMLMDAGVLHHIKHARAFEDTASSSYFFDQYSIQLYDPIAILEDRGSDAIKDSALLASPTHRGAAAGADAITASPTAKKSKSQALKSALHFGAPASRLFSLQWTNHSNRTLFSRVAGLGSHDHADERDELSSGSAGANGVPHVHEARGSSQCRCRKLSQRLEVSKPSVRRKLRRKFRELAVVPEDSLTTNLLLADGDHESVAVLVAAPGAVSLCDARQQPMSATSTKRAKRFGVLAPDSAPAPDSALIAEVRSPMLM